MPRQVGRVDRRNLGCAQLGMHASEQPVLRSCRHERVRIVRRRSVDASAGGGEHGMVSHALVRRVLVCD